MRLYVKDPLKRQWTRSIYTDSHATAQDVVRLRREAQARGEPEPEGGWQNWTPKGWEGKWYVKVWCPAPSVRGQVERRALKIF